MTDAPERITLSMYRRDYVRDDVAARKDARIAELGGEIEHIKKCNNVLKDEISELEKQLATAKERALEAERAIQTGWFQSVEAARKSGFEEMRQAAIEIVEFELPH